MGVNTKELIENNRKVTVGRRSNMKMVENRKELRDNHSPKEILHSDRAKHSEGIIILIMKISYKKPGLH